MRVATLALLAFLVAGAARGQETLPTLTQPVNDFANVIDPASRAKLEDLSRRLDAATGDAIVVATRQSIAPFADERELAVKWFENNGRGIGDREKDTGVLVLLVPQDRAVWVEVGYGLEGAITDGFSGQMSRQVMAPLFREGRYGEGLVAGVTEIARRIAQERNVTLADLPPPPRVAPRQSVGIPLWLIILLFLLFLWLSSRGAGGGGPGVRGRRGRAGSMWGPAWSGWGTGMTTGGFGGGSFGGGSFGGGFGGFGGGMSGGGGGGARW